MKRRSPRLIRRENIDIGCFSAKSCGNPRLWRCAYRDSLYTYNLPIGGENWSADPKYTVPFTTAGDDDTICSLLVRSCVNGRQIGLLQPFASNTSTMPLFSPTYTTPLATAGAEIMAA